MSLSNSCISAFALSLALAAAGCTGHGQSVKLLGSSAVPAASGTLHVSSDANQNTSVDLRVQHLAEPQRVDSKASVYVVWLKPSESSAEPQPQAMKLGALKVNGELTGELKTTTPYKSFQLFVTAEPSLESSAPTTSPLLTASVKSAG